jgi:LAGLIDADG endonuclease
LDGDGSIHFQLVRQDGYRFGFYIRASLSLSQSTSDRHGLEKIQTLIGAGYLRDRGTGMSDLVITSRPVLIEVLTQVEPYAIFKHRQVREALRILRRIRRGLHQDEFLEIAREVDAFSALNHSKTKRIFAADVERHLQGMGLLAPVTTPSTSLVEGMETPTVQTVNLWAP